MYGMVASQVANATTATPSTNSDTQKPTVEITSPSGNAFTSKTTISITAIDNIELSKVVGNIYQSDGTLYVSTQVTALGVERKVHSIDLNTVMNGTSLPQGKYSIRYNALDKAGNLSQTKTFSFTVDNTLPTIAIKSSSVGNSGVYQEIDFKLHDNNKIVKAIINDHEKLLTPNAYSDVNDVKVGGNGGKYGGNTIRALDASGNESSLNFTLDNKAPTVTYKGGSNTTGSGPYSKVSFSLYDDYKVAKAVVNGKTIPLSPDKWSDLNNIKVGSMGGQSGSNKVEIYDVAGNVTTVEFELDNTAPQVVSLTHSNNNDNKLVNTNVTSTLRVNEPIRELEGWTTVEGSNNQEFTKVSTANNKATVSIIDLAGNSSTFFFEVKRIDKIEPTFNITDGSVFSGGEIVVTEDNIDSITVNDSKVTYVGTKPNYKFSVTDEGKYTVIAKDKAGNKSTVVFTIDKTAPAVVIHDIESDKIYNKKLDIVATIEDANLSGYELTITRNGVERVIKVSTEQDLKEKLIETLAEDGNYTLKLEAVDEAGLQSSATVSFSIDTVAPNVQVSSAGVTTNSITVSGTTDDSSSNVVVALADGTTRTATPKNGVWSVTFTGLTPGETYNYAVTSTDAAGNEFSTGLMLLSATTEDVVTRITTTQRPVPSVASPEASTASAFARVFTLPGETANDDQDDNAAVLGVQTERNNGSSNQFAAAVPTADGWKIFGLMWYWWLLIVAAVAGLIWFIAGARRRSQEDAI